MRRIDCHVNVLPDWTAEINSRARLRGETPSLRRHFSHPKSIALHAKSRADRVRRTLAVSKIVFGIATPFQFRSVALCNEASEEIATAVAENPGKLFGLATVQPRS